MQITRDITSYKMIEKQLKEQIAELQRWQRATLGRENRVVELKREVNELLISHHQSTRYQFVGEADAQEAQDSEVKNPEVKD